LFQNEWNELFPLAVNEGLTSLGSDHAPHFFFFYQML